RGQEADLVVLEDGVTREIENVHRLTAWAPGVATRAAAGRLHRGAAEVAPRRRPSESARAPGEPPPDPSDAAARPARDRRSAARGRARRRPPRRSSRRPDPP